MVTSAIGRIGQFAGATGTVTVTGPIAAWNLGTYQPTVGDDGTGTLNISAGGTVTSSDGFIGYNSDTENSAVTVSGPNSTWYSSGDIYVGNYGTGTLTIEAGGTVESVSGSIGAWRDDATGTVSVTGAGSSWTMTGELAVGDNGAGTLTIAAGGTVTSGAGYIGREEDALGAVTVKGEGAQALWDLGTASLYVGYSATGNGSVAGGRLTIEAGGTVTSGASTSAMKPARPEW